MSKSLALRRLDVKIDRIERSIEECLAHTSYVTKELEAAKLDINSIEYQKIPPALPRLVPDQPSP